MVDKDRIARDERVLQALHELRIQAESIARERQAASAPFAESYEAAPSSGCGVSKELAVVARPSSGSSFYRAIRR